MNYDNILNAIGVYIDYAERYRKITDCRSILEEEHSKFINACHILRGINLSGLEAADLLLKGDKKILERIIEKNKGNRISSST